MTNAVFYGFQFPHHGRFSAFSAMSREMAARGVRVRSLPLPGLLFRRGFRRLREPWFRMSERLVKPCFDQGGLVHYFFPENSLFRGPEWKNKGRLVLSCHQPVATLHVARNNGQLSSFISGLQAADAVVLMASVELEAYRELAPRARVCFLPHGVDTGFFAPGEPPSAEDGVFRVLTLGNWLRDYELWAQVAEALLPGAPKVEFSLLANPGVLADAVSRLSCGGSRVRILQGISDRELREEYRRADLVFLPLLDAWANNALLECMACGRPVLVTDLPATREYCGDAVRYLPKGNLEAAVAGIRELMSAPAARTELGRRAREQMASGFSWARIARLHEDLYRSVSKDPATKE